MKKILDGLENPNRKGKLKSRIVGEPEETWQEKAKKIAKEVLKTLVTLGINWLVKWWKSRDGSS